MHRSRRRVGLSLFLSFTALIWSGGATASPDLPLAPADTSSPRATLQSFITAVDAIYADLNQTTQSTERRVRFKRRMIRIASCLDLSQVAPSLVGSKR